MKRAYYNEPTSTPRGDVIPKLKRVVPAKLSRVVRTRLALESDLRICGLAKPGPSIKVNAAVRRVLVNMLTELDSPLSASLRARAAGAAGKLRIKEATSSLRRIALDEADDLTTRIAAVTSYLQLRGSATATDVKSLLCSRAWQLRATVYAHILNDPSEMTREIGEARFKRERNVKVRSYVSRRVKSVRSAESTQDDE